MSKFWWKKLTVNIKNADFSVVLQSLDKAEMRQSHLRLSKIFQGATPPGPLLCPVIQYWSVTNIFFRPPVSDRCDKFNISTDYANLSIFFLVEQKLEIKLPVLHLA